MTGPVRIELESLPDGGVRARTPAKVNLWLHVLGPRPDGFHEIDTLMVAFDLRDDLEVRRAGAGIRMEVTEGDAPAGESNLCARAARLWCEATGEPEAFHIRLAKRIPTAAGLGGGSGNAAGALLALDRLREQEGGEPLPLDEMQALSAGLGSDVPFFLLGGTARCQGRGERVESWAQGVDALGILIYAGLSVSTAEVYRSSRKIPARGVNPDILTVNLGFNEVWVGRGSPKRGTLEGRAMGLLTTPALADGVDREGDRRPRRTGVDERVLEFSAERGSLSTAGAQGDPFVCLTDDTTGRPYLRLALRNDLEAAALEVCPELATVRERLSAAGVEPVILCGSGSAYFAPTADEDVAADLLGRVRSIGYDATLVRSRATDVAGRASS